MTNPVVTAMETSVQSDPKATPQARGKRVETLRSMTRLSRRAFQEKYGIAKTSLQNWEDAHGNGLTKKGAHKLIAVLKHAGITCSFEWLMYGIGSSPQVSELLFIEADSNGNHLELPAIDDDVESARIMEELAVFHQHYPRIAIDYVVPDDGMEPRFSKADHVAGCKYHGKAVEGLVGMDCIVQTHEGETLLRTIKKSHNNGRYDLVCSNPNTTVAKPVLYEVEILSAAPVIWVRRKNTKS